jgi:uncharacterized membrane protein
MRIVQHTIWIDRPRNAVFAFFTDFSQATRWRQYVESMAIVTEGPLRVGSRIRTTIALMGETTALDMEVLAFDPPSLWRHRTFESDFSGYIEYRFETENAGTRVTLTIEAKPEKAYGWLALPIMWLNRLLKRSKPYAQQLPQLKRVLEEVSPAA